MKSDNELIAEFMGFEKTGPFYESAGTRHDKYRSPDFGYTYAAQWAFDTSWYWLMPVVEKIEDVALNVSIETACVTIEVMDDAYPIYKHTETFEYQEDTKLNVLYRSVVKYIRWYNSQSLDKQ